MNIKKLLYEYLNNESNEQPWHVKSDGNKMKVYRFFSGEVEYYTGQEIIILAENKAEALKKLKAFIKKCPDDIEYNKIHEPTKKDLTLETHDVFMTYCNDG